MQYDDVHNSTCEWASALHPLPTSRQQNPSPIDGMAMGPSQCERTNREHQRSQRPQLAVRFLCEIYAGHT